MINVHEIEKIPMNCSMTEFVGTTVLDTIGLVIPGVDPSLLKQMNLKKSYRSLGLISSRTGAAGQINAVDEAVKSTNTEVVSIELPRDTKGWGGHGNYIIIGGDNVSDVRRAVEIALEYTEKYAGELYISDAGHLEFTFSANADQALNLAFDAPVGKPFGFFCGSPAAIGMVMADLAVKSASVEIVKYMTHLEKKRHLESLGMENEASKRGRAYWESGLRTREHTGFIINRVVGWSCLSTLFFTFILS